MPGAVQSFVDTLQTLTQMDREKKQQQEMAKYRQQEVDLRKQEIEARKTSAAAAAAHTNFMEGLNLDKFFEMQKRNMDLADKALTDEEGRNKRATDSEAGRNTRAEEVNKRVLAGQAATDERFNKRLEEQKRVDDARIPKIVADTETAIVKRDLMKKTMEDDATYKTWRAQHEKNIAQQDATKLANLKADLTLKGIHTDTAKFDLAFKQRYAVPKAELDMQVKQIELQKKRGDGAWTENAKKQAGWLEKQYTTANSNYERVFGERMHQIDAKVKAQAIVDALAPIEKKMGENMNGGDRVLLEDARSKLRQLNPRIMLLHSEVQGYDDERKAYKAQANKLMHLTAPPLTGGGEVDQKRLNAIQSGKAPGAKGGRADNSQPSLQVATKGMWLQWLKQTGGDPDKAKVLAAQNGYR